MIKKARDLKPGDVVGGKRLIIARVDGDSVFIYTEVEGGYKDCWAADDDVWVDEEAPQGSYCKVEFGKPVSKGRGGPFYVEYSKEAYHGGCHYVVKTNHTGSIGWWYSLQAAEDVAAELNSLFSQQPRVVTKRAFQLRKDDQLITTIGKVSHDCWNSTVTVEGINSKTGKFKWYDEVSVLYADED